MADGSDQHNSFPQFRPQQHQQRDDGALTRQDPPNIGDSSGDGTDLDRAASPAPMRSGDDDVQSGGTKRVLKRVFSATLVCAYFVNFTLALVRVNNDNQ